MRYLRTLALSLGLLFSAACGHMPMFRESTDPLTPQEHVSLAVTYEAQGLTEQAVRQYEAAVRLDPEYADAWLALGNLHFTQGRTKKAEKYFRKTLKISPDNPAACNNLAMAILARSGDLGQAQKLVSKALLTAGELEPYVLDTQAAIFLRQRRYELADAALDKAEAAASADKTQVREQLARTRANIAAAAAKDKAGLNLNRQLP